MHTTGLSCQETCSLTALHLDVLRGGGGVEGAMTPIFPGCKTGSERRSLAPGHAARNRVSWDVDLDVRCLCPKMPCLCGYAHPRGPCPDSPLLSSLIPFPLSYPFASGSPQLDSLAGWPRAQPWPSPLAFRPAWDVQLEPCHPSSVFQQQRTGGVARAGRPQSEA